MSVGAPLSATKSGGSTTSSGGMAPEVTGRDKSRPYGNDVETHPLETYIPSRHSLLSIAPLALPRLALPICAFVFAIRKRRH